MTVPQSAESQDQGATHPSLTVADEMAEEIVRMKKMLHNLDHSDESLVVVKSVSNGSNGGGTAASSVHGQQQPTTAATLAARLSLPSSSSDESRNDSAGRAVPPPTPPHSVAGSYSDIGSVKSSTGNGSPQSERIRSRVLEATIEGARKQIASLKAQLQVLQEKNDNTAEVSAEAQRYKIENEHLSKQLIIVQEQHKRMSSTHTNLMKQIEDSNALNADLNKQVQNLTSEVLQLKINDETTQESLKNARNEIDIATDRFNHLRKRYESKEAKISTLVDTSKSLKDDKKALEEKTERLHTKLQGTTKRATNERSLFKDKSQKFVSEIKYWKDMNEQLARQKTTYINQIDILKKEKDQLETEIDEKQYEVNTLTSKVFDLETMTSENVMELEATNTQNERAIMKLNSKMREMSEKNTNLEKQLLGLGLLKDSLQQSKDELTLSLEETTSDKNKFKEELKSDKEMYTYQIKNLEGMYSTLNESYRTLQESHEQLKRTHDKTNIAYSKLITSNASLQDELTTLTDQNRNLREENETFAEDYDEQKSKYKDLKTRLEESKSTYRKQLQEWKDRSNLALKCNQRMRNEVSTIRTYQKEQIKNFLEKEIQHQEKFACTLDDHVIHYEKVLLMADDEDIILKHMMGTSDNATIKKDDGASKMKVAMSVSTTATSEKKTQAGQSKTGQDEGVKTDDEDTAHTKSPPSEEEDNTEDGAVVDDDKTQDEEEVEEEQTGTPRARGGESLAPPKPQTQESKPQQMTNPLKDSNKKNNKTSSIKTKRPIVSAKSVGEDSTNILSFISSDDNVFSDIADDDGNEDNDDEISVDSVSSRSTGASSDYDEEDTNTAFTYGEDEGSLINDEESALREPDAWFWQWTMSNNNNAE